MSKNAHTPGPWFHHGPSGSQHTAGGFVNSTADRNGSPVVCSIYGTGGQPYEANARLIAAAPDLLDALEYALPSLGFEEKAKAVAAIAKARGES